jgi:hypothetical protein
MMMFVRFNNGEDMHYIQSPSALQALKLCRPLTSTAPTHTGTGYSGGRCHAPRSFLGLWHETGKVIGNELASFVG